MGGFRIPRAFLAGLWRRARTDPKHLLVPVTRPAAEIDRDLRLGIAQVLYLPEAEREAKRSGAAPGMAPGSADAAREVLPVPTDPEQRASWTDAPTGLPNRRCWVLEARRRILAAGGAPVAFGLIGFFVEGVDEARAAHGPAGSDRLLGEAARRLAGAREAGEIVFRFEERQFLLLVPDGRSRVLAARSLDLLRCVQAGPVHVGLGRSEPVRIRAVPMNCPSPAQDVDALIRMVDDRLATGRCEGSSVLAFPGGRWSGSSGVD